MLTSNYIRTLLLLGENIVSSSSLLLIYYYYCIKVKMNKTPSEDSGLSSIASPTPPVQGESKLEEVDETNMEGDKSKEYVWYTQEVIKMAKETMTDKKRVITNPGWHANKPGLCQIPIDMNKTNSLPGYGQIGKPCCQKTAEYCGNLCGCPSPKTLRIGSIRVAARIVMAVLLWAFMWSVTFPPCAENKTKGVEENETMATMPMNKEECKIPGLPGSNLFGILMVFLWGMVAEALIVLIPLPCGLPSLPPLLGSLLVGILLRNVSGIDVAIDINELWSTRLRNMALGIILGRAGLEVDKKQMYKLRWVVPRLSFLPCIVEACSYGVFGHLILGLPWEWSFLLGFVCSAVAPACVVPSMIKFQEEGLGVDHGVPSLLIAAASIDDIVAINVFNILLTIVFGGSSIGIDIGIAFAEIVLGIVLGLVGGFFLHKVPDRRQHNVIRDRTFLLIILSFFFIFVTDGPIDLAGAGTLGTLVCSFVAAVGWQLNQAEAVAHHFKAIWFYFQPLLFGLTGATVDFSKMDGETVGKALACMVICLAIRLIVAGTSVSRLGWSRKEKFMTAISWIPKATVQAAIGGAALSRVDLECGDILSTSYCNDTTSSGPDFGFNKLQNLTGNVDDLTEIFRTCVQYGTPQAERKQTCEEWEGYANIILQVSVLLILITAPIGVFLIGIAGPRLLKKTAPEENVSEHEGDGKTSIHNDNDVHNDVGVWMTNDLPLGNGVAGREIIAYNPGKDGETKV